MGVIAHASLLAEDFRRTDPGTAAAEDVGREDFLRRALHVVVLDVADERGNVDLAWTGIDARRVIAIQAARGFEVSLALVERRRQVAEMAGEGGGVFNGMGEVGQGLDHGYGLTVMEVLPLSGIGCCGVCDNAIAGKPAPTGGSGVHKSRESWAATVISINRDPCERRPAPVISINRDPCGSVACPR